MLKGYGGSYDPPYVVPLTYFLCHLTHRFACALCRGRWLHKECTIPVKLSDRTWFTAAPGRGYR